MYTNIIIFIIGLINIGLMGAYFRQFLGIIFGVLCIFTSVYLLVSEGNSKIFRPDTNKIHSSNFELEKEGKEYTTPDKNE